MAREEKVVFKILKLLKIILNISLFDIKLTKILLKTIKVFN